ncbi:hypothetical protein H2200_001246 [Cladophialophora chaetospira]|uniref:Xylanolytic transcriptional activator regulatory domain-containing protein n=1 Tax=Cladophialophora chaetospira TaxID=386627 RepID=A0AA39CPE6_9EURO|nr:hypothetical protein H2200_001246 [Cladophialophora chaetospira]
MVSSGHSVHAIIGATLDEDNSEGYFGTSSAGTFMQSVKKLVQQKIYGIPGLPLSSPLTHGRTPPASGHYITQPKPVEYVLPSRRRADILMSCYWRYVHVLYPYLDKMQMEEDYEKLWKADGSIVDERSFMCLINVIFALSSQIDESTPIGDRQRTAQVFYLRAKELLDIVETGSVRSVQSLLLLGQYYQSTSEPHPCWIFTGLAIRTAQSLGLHFTETSECAADIRTRELFRKVWHGCILMDRVVSMTYGRPCMVGPKAALAVPLPLPIDEEYLTPENSQSRSPQAPRTYSVEFYVLSLKLYDVMHDILFSFYSVNGQACQPGEAKDLTFLDQGQNSVFEIERRLSRWADSIPTHLRLNLSNKPNSGTAEATLHRQAVVLHQRKLHVRLLLLRPVLSAFITSEFHDGDRPVPLDSLLSQRVYLQCAIVCVKVALEAIDTIHKAKGSGVGELNFCSAWWYNVLYLYTSATVLIAARLSPAVLADVSEESVLSGWRIAMEILEEYSVIGASIKRLTTTLRLLLEAVPQQYSRLKGNARQGQTDVSSAPQVQPENILPQAAWRPQASSDFLSTFQDDANGGLLGDDGDLENAVLLDFDTVFDPNDLSWLTTIPLDA